MVGMVVGTAVGVRVRMKEEAESIAIDGLPFTRLERTVTNGALATSAPPAGPL